MPEPMLTVSYLTYYMYRPTFAELETTPDGAVLPNPIAQFGCNY